MNAIVPFVHERFIEALTEVGPNSDKTMTQAKAFPRFTAGLRN